METIKCNNDNITIDNSYSSDINNLKENINYLDSDINNLYNEINYLDKEVKENKILTDKLWSMINILLFDIAILAAAIIFILIYIYKWRY